MKQTGSQRYVSDELSHFVGRTLPAAEDQYQMLVKILLSGWLTHPPHQPSISGNLTVNPNHKLSENVMYCPDVVCFCDIPLQDIHQHASKYSSFGLALPKSIVVSRGGTPVFYLPKGAAMRARKKLADGELEPTRESSGSTEEDVALGELCDRVLPDLHCLMEELRKFMKDAHKPLAGTHPDRDRLHELRQFLDFRVFSYVKFFDETLAEDDPQNFYMEREWRVIGNVKFDLRDVARVFIPGAYGERLRRDVPGFFGQVTFLGKTRNEPEPSGEGMVG